MKALFIIDMQAGSFKPETQRFDVENIVRKINLLSERFRQNGDKVIFIQYDGTKEDYFIPGTPDWDILPSLVQMPEDICISKVANDSFYATELESVLKEHGIMELFITGCATDFCVDATVHSALTRDFSTVVVKDCHTTTDRPHLSAEKVIEHHNWIWKNLTPTKGKIRMLSSKDLLDHFR